MQYANIETLDTVTTIDRAALSLAMDKACKVIDRKNSVPVLTTAKITSHNGYLAIKGTDLDHEITSLVEAIATPGQAWCLPSHRLQSLVKKAKNADFVSISGDYDANIKIGPMTVEMGTLPLDDFPSSKHKIEHKERVTMIYHAKDLLKTLQRCAPSISTEETRYYLNGVGVDLHADQVTFVATDGHRLSKVPCEPRFMSGEKWNETAIIPRNAVKLVIDLLKHRQGPKGFVSMEITERSVSFYIGDDTIKSKLIDGTFPDYHRVIPSSPQNGFTVDKKQMLDAVTALAQVSNEHGRAIKIDLSTDNINLSINAPDIGDAKSELSASLPSEQSEGMTIGYNSSYLLDILKLLEGETVTFLFNDDAGSPALIQDEKQEFNFVLMPMRI